MGDEKELLALLESDDLDAAIEAGLMDSASDDARIRAAQEKLRTAWAARERYRAREARLERIAAERAARRAPPQAQKQNALPASAAAILERAKAKAAQKQQQ